VVFDTHLTLPLNFSVAVAIIWLVRTKTAGIARGLPELDLDLPLLRDQLVHSASLANGPNLLAGGNVKFAFIVLPHT
jgi:hypothetical protein